MKASEARKLTEQFIEDNAQNEKVLDLIYDEIKNEIKNGEYRALIHIRNYVKSTERVSEIRKLLEDQGYVAVPCLGDPDTHISWKGPEQ